ncbi:MAG: hypothetical protein IJ172_00435 [Ruminococcus sp.]|nr:hypothetical protein [Ruminococcus sp.]MBQ8119232.1 hypothetical protein [Ruminococcus sp.]
MYQPESPFIKPLILLIPTKITNYNGVRKYSDYQPSLDIIFSSFKTYGGTEIQVNGTIVIEETAIVETWYRPDIKSNCHISTTEGAEYEILGEPEDIKERHQFLRFKIRRLKGGA